MHLGNNLIWIALAVVVIARIGWPIIQRRRQPSTSSRQRRRIIKNRTFVAFRGLLIASLKMYFRNRTAIFFSLFFPLVFITVFGLIFKNSGSTTFKIDVTYQSKTDLAAQLKEAFAQVPAFKINEVSTEQASKDLDKGDTDLAITVPANFGVPIESGFGTPENPNHPEKIQPTKIIAHYNSERPGNGQAAAQIVSEIVTGFNDSLTGTPKIITSEASGVKTKNLTYIDFLLPGMIGLSIMQIGIFSVAFGFVSYKTTGTLRRLQATPVHPGSFLAAQGLTRLIMGVLQTALLATIGIVFFGFNLAPASWVPFVILTLLGSIVFQEIGFAIAGWAKNEDQAQPVAQLIQFPMMFLSGTFFPRDSFPAVLQTITGYLPLTFLADALRHVANDNASLWAVRGDLLGLVVWGIVAGLIAVRLFSWE